MIPAERVAAVVTAAGLSSRMGFPKALVDWQGRPLVGHQVATLAGLGQVIVVLGHEAERIRPAVPAPATVVLNPDYASGRVSSLRAGFRAIAGTPDAVLVVGVDQPLVPAVLATLLAQAPPDADVVVPTFEGRRGHPVLFAGRLLDELRTIDEASEGLRAVVRRHTRQEVAVNHPSVLRDLNTPADLNQA